MVRKVLQVGDPILEKRSQPVKNISSPEVQSLIADLVETCQNKEDITAGISAPQVGENLCIIVCRRMDIEEEKGVNLSPKEAWEVMINPEVLSLGKKQSSYWEGCLSVGEGPNGLYAPVSRPDSVEIKYLDRMGKEKRLTCKGFFSHIVQHELDHLEGILFIRYVDDPEQIWKSKDLDKYYEEHGEYPPV